MNPSYDTCIRPKCTADTFPGSNYCRPCYRERRRLAEASRKRSSRHAKIARDARAEQKASRKMEADAAEAAAWWDKTPIPDDGEGVPPDEIAKRAALIRSCRLRQPCEYDRWRGELVLPQPRAESVSVNLPRRGRGE